MCFSCNNQSSLKQSPNFKYSNANNTDSSCKSNNTTKNLLQGIWAENDKDNALFFIKDDTIIFVEHPEWISTYEIKRDTIIIHYYAGGDSTYSIKYLITKITNDSFVFHAFENNSIVNRLYKRK